MVMLTGVWASAFGATLGDVISDILDAQKVEADAINIALKKLGLKDLRPLAGSLPNYMKGIPADIEAASFWRKLGGMMLSVFRRKSQRSENQPDATKGKNVKRSKIRYSFRVFFYKDAETESDNVDGRRITFIRVVNCTFRF